MFATSSVAVYVMNGDKVLVSKRKEGTVGAGIVCLPGGKIDFGESILTAAVRETYEETGVWITNVALGPYVVHKDKDYHFICTFVSAEAMANSVPINKEPEKHEDWYWLDYDKIPVSKWMPENLLKNPNFIPPYLGKDFGIDS